MEPDKAGMLKRLLSNELSTLKTECAALSNDVRELVSICELDLKTMCDALLRSCKEVDRERDEAVRLYKMEEARRRDCLNQLHTLKGNIRVVCRVRPVNRIDEEKGSKDLAVIRMSREVVRCDGKNFEFDEVFGPKHTNTHVFDEALPMVESVFEGYHACIFAYGQTGSGKTFTMSGSPSDRGVNYRAVERLFEMRTAMLSSGLYSAISFHVSNVEIYNEAVRDILARGEEAPELQIRQDIQTGIHLPGCTRVKVESIKAVLETMEFGQKNRAQALTKMNSESSRSHSVFMVEVEAVERHESEQGKLMRGKLILVDLAGSERLSKSGVSGERQREAQCINKSLSALGDVISALGAKSNHVPFRNSKLTYLLQDSMSKQNKVMMIVQTAPTSYNMQESLCTLAFGARARAVELGRAEARIALEDAAKPVQVQQRTTAAVANSKQQNSLLLQKMSLEQKLFAMERALAEAEARAALAERTMAKKEEALTKAERDKDDAIARFNAQLRTKKTDSGGGAGIRKSLGKLHTSLENPQSKRQMERDKAAAQVKARLAEQERIAREARERAATAQPQQESITPLRRQLSSMPLMRNMDDGSDLPLPLPPPFSANSLNSISSMKQTRSLSSYSSSSSRYGMESDVENHEPAIRPRKLLSAINASSTTSTSSRALLGGLGGPARIAGGISAGNEQPNSTRPSFSRRY